MSAFRWCALFLSLSSFLLAAAVPPDGTTLSKKGGVTIPLVRRGLAKRDFKDGDIVGGSVGLGDSFDVFYSAVVEVGNSTVTLALDMTYGDITVISSNCTIGPQCGPDSQGLYDPSPSFQPVGTSVVWSVVEDSLGDELQADVRFGRDTVTLAGLTMANQSILVIDNYTSPNGSLPFGDEAGRLGLGFPLGIAVNFAGAGVLGSVLGGDASNLTYWMKDLPKVGGIIHRLILAGAIEKPLYTVTLQRDTIDVSGTGQLTIGQLPEGIDESNITWVPVRLITPEEGGWAPNVFAPNELYPRWELELDAVFVDGKNVTALDGGASNSTALSAAIDVRYPYLDAPSSASDAIKKVLGSHAGVYWDCDSAHNLTFQIGGKLFPVDPRDFYSNNGLNVTECTSSIQDRRLSPSHRGRSAPYNWTLGVPFLKSNAVVFYFGNLTHPSVDPPKIGLVSLVPENASELLQDAVSKAESASMGLPATIQAAPTNSRVITKSASSTSTTGPGPAATGSSNAGDASYSPGQAFVRMVFLLVLRAFVL